MYIVISPFQKRCISNQAGRHVDTVCWYVITKESKDVTEAKNFTFSSLHIQVRTL